QSCVDCHSRLQPDARPWSLGALMGALVIDQPADDALAIARRDAWLAGLAAFGACYGIGIGTYLLATQVQRVRTRAERRARDRLAGAIENISDAIAVFDREDRLVIANPAYRHIHAMIADVLVP